MGAAAPCPVPLSTTDCVLATLPELSITCRFAVRAPAALGVKATETVHVPFTATGVLQVLVWLKSAGFVPPTTTCETVSGPVPEFVTVTVCAVAELPSVVVAKVSVFGEAAAEGTPTPVPPSETVCVAPALFPALSVITNVALRMPGAPGVNVTDIEHVDPAATWALVQVFVAAKSAALVPLRLTPLTVSAPVPELLRVMICAALATLTF